MCSIGFLIDNTSHVLISIDLVAASLDGGQNDGTSIHYIENLGSSGFTATVLGNAWHSFGNNNMLMQDFIGTAP